MLRCLIANRGEIAVRIIRACREYGIETVAVYAKGDEQSLHVHLADQAICIGEANALDSYLNIDRIISAAQITGANAIHPGYGFLSESTKFAQTVEEQGIAFIGPTKKTMEMMGDKITARQTVHHAGVPVIPGSNGAVNHVSEIENLAKDIGYPVVIKAASGGGGKGIRIVKKAEDLEKAFKEAKSEGKKYFDDDRVYVEAFIPVAKHVEVQVMGDGQDNYVHLGERDLVAAQLYLLEHNHLPFSQSDIQFNGHVIEARINAENPEKKFQPTPGKVTALHLPQGFNVRVDSLLYHGYQVSPYYDSLVAKVIVKSHDRASAIDKLKVTLDEMVIDGFSTTADFLYAVLNYPLYRDGDAKDVDIKFLEKHQIVKGVEL
ncbi:TPA: biotin carboxylase N-terminal domain-containing protein [Staphylococcus aureus]